MADEQRWHSHGQVPFPKSRASVTRLRLNSRGTGLIYENGRNRENTCRIQSQVYRYGWSKRPWSFRMRKSACRFLSFALLLSKVLLFSALAEAGTPRANSSFPKPKIDQPVANESGQEIAVLSGGCFWGIQAIYQHMRGVISATSGYAGGHAESAHYEMVDNGNTGHAESVQIVYDPRQTTYGQILMVFFAVAHNPTELDKQGPDWGTQYRSAVFYANEGQKRIVTAYIAQLEKAKVYPQKIMTQVGPLTAFYPAEGYHQDYVRHHLNDPYIVINDLPKLASFKKQFPELYKEN